MVFELWKYFDKDEGNFAKCVICGILISQGGILKNSFNTTNIRKHLKRCHQKEFEELTQKEREILEKTNQIFKKKSPESQPTISAILNKTNIWKHSDPKSIIISKFIGEMITCDHQPISILEDIGFKRLLHHLCPNYKIPNRKYFSHGVIPDIYEKLSEKIRKEILVDDSFLSFTVNIWTRSSGGDSHISLTCHYINQNFQQINRVLNVKTFNESHTAINIAQILDEIINYWGIKKNKIHLIIRDNAPNITLAMKNGKFQSVSCFAHKIQIRLSLAQHKLIQDVPTRWDSTYYMLERLIEQKRAVQLFIIDNPNLGNLSLYEWELAERVIDVLEPIQRVTKEISTESCSISNVIPFVEILKSELTINGDTDRGVQTMKNTTNNQLTTRFFDIYDDDNYVVATLLDPRYKDFFLPKNISYIEKLRTAYLWIVNKNVETIMGWDWITKLGPRNNYWNLLSLVANWLKKMPKEK
ncbi:zinc finger BED domain-containing protein 4-like [Gordionus sp. m RMFG-2023]|uniref:zinc finger BED domain-containing protein 4-like n=1 Tax=Gordionus sp. m RMFG-2023 TaxID=3053472 RepID=UPI0031FC992C